MKKVLYVIIILFLVVAFLPTLISTKKGQEWTLKWINHTIPGRLEVKSFQIGWFSKQKIEELKLFDANENVILAFDHLDTEASLFNLLIKRYNLGKTELKNPFLHYVENADGVSNLEVATDQRLETNDKEFDLPKIKGTITVENGTLIYETSHNRPIKISELFIHTQQKEKTAQVTGKIEQDGISGKLLANGNFGKEPHVLIDIESFPVSFLDGVFKSAFFTKAIGSKMNLHLEVDKRDKKVTASLKMDAANLNGEIVGHTEKGRFHLDKPGALVFTITPALFDEMVANPNWTMGNKTQVILNIQEFSYPLRLKKLDFSSIPLVGNITVERAEIAKQDVGTFSLNGFVLNFSTKENLHVDYSGNIQSKGGGTDIKGNAILNSEKKWLFTGDIKSFPVAILELFSKTPPPIFGNSFDLIYSGSYHNKKLYLDFDLLTKLFKFKGLLKNETLDGKGEIFIPKYRASLIGDNPLFNLHADLDFENQKLSFPYFKTDIKNSTLDFVMEGKIGEKGKPISANLMKISGSGTFNKVPLLQALEEGSLFFEIDGEKNKAFANIKLFSPSQLLRTFQAEILADSFIENGAFHYEKGHYVFHGNASDFPIQLLNNLLGDNHPYEALFGKTLNFEFAGDHSFQIVPGQEESHLTIDADGEGFKLSTALIKEGNLRLSKDKPSFIDWTLTPERYLTLLQLSDLSASPTYKLLKPTTLHLKLKDLVCPTTTEIPIKSFFAECGLVGEFSADDFYFVNSQQNEVSIHDLNGVVHGEDFAKLLYLDLRGSIEAPTIPRKQNAGFTFIGEVIDLLTSDNRFNKEKVKIKGDLAFDLIPIQQILGVFPMKNETRQKIHAILGDLMNARIYGEIQNLTGTLTVDIKASNFKTLMPIYLENGVLKLREKVEAEITLTPEVSETFLRDINPLILKGAWSAHPVKLVIEPQGFYIPLRPFSIQTVNIERAIIDIGKFQVQNGGQIQSLMDFVKSQEITPDGVMNAWFTPIYFNLKNGVISYNWFDILLAENVHIALWGSIDLANDHVNMVLGISPSTLQERFNIKEFNKNEMFQVKMTGPSSHVNMDWSSAKGRIAVLVARSTGGPLGPIIGGIVEQVSGATEEPTPPPTTYPFPWGN